MFIDYKYWQNNVLNPTIYILFLRSWKNELLK